MTRKKIRSDNYQISSTAHNNSGRRKQQKQKPPKLRFNLKIPLFFGTLIRWGIALLMLTLLAGSISAREAAKSDAEQLELELQQLEHERTALQEDLERFSDPEWREKYWKWRTMRHEPGEYYIDFIEPGIL